MTEVLRLNFESDFSDSSASSHAVTVNGTPVINTVTPLFGIGSGEFVSGDCLSISVNSDFNFTGQFTVRLSIKPITSADVDYVVFDMGVDGFFWIKFMFGNLIIFQKDYDFNIAASIDYTVYNEISLERCSDGEYYLYANGTLISNTTGASGYSMPYNASGTLSISANGLIDKVIIDNSSALAGGASNYVIDTPNAINSSSEFEFIAEIAIYDAIESEFNFVSTIELAEESTFEFSSTIELVEETAFEFNANIGCEHEFIFTAIVGCLVEAEFNFNAVIEFTIETEFQFNSTVTISNTNWTEFEFKPVIMISSDYGSMVVDVHKPEVPIHGVY